MHPQVQRTSSALYDGVEVELYIDHVEIMKWLGPRAAHARGGKAQAMRGLVLVKRKKPKAWEGPGHTRPPRTTKEPTAKNLERLFRL